MKSCNLSLAFFLALAAAVPLRAETYVIDPANVITGDVLIRPGEALDKSILVKNGNLVVEGDLLGSCVITEGGSVTVKKGGHVHGGILSYGGPVNIAGEAYRVSSYKAPVLISGQATHVRAIEAEVTLSSSAAVTGKIIVTSSKVTIAPGARIKTPVREQEPPDTGFPDYGVHKITPNIESVPGFGAALGLLLILPALFTRRSVAGSAIMLRESFWKSSGAGAAGCCVLALIGLCSMKTLILFPLAAPVVGLGVPALVIGCSAFCKMLGDKTLAALGRTAAEPVLAIVTGYAALILIGTVWVAITILSHLAWIRPISADAILGHICDVSGFLSLIAGIIGAGALARITPSPFSPEQL